MLSERRKSGKAQVAAVLVLWKMTIHIIFQNLIPIFVNISNQDFSMQLFCHFLMMLCILIGIDEMGSNT